MSSSVSRYGLPRRFRLSGDVVVVKHTIGHDGLIEGDDEAQKRLYPLFDLLTVEHPELKSGVLVTGDQFVAS